ncbi:MAG: sigma-70 family RNA polymerase sigma factor, partial [Acidobacteriota bacterium]
ELGLGTLRPVGIAGPDQQHRPGTELCQRQGQRIGDARLGCVSLYRFGIESSPCFSRDHLTEVPGASPPVDRSWARSRRRACAGSMAMRRNSMRPAFDRRPQVKLVERLVEGEQAAWREFVDLYIDLIYATVRTRLSTTPRVSDVDDVVQDVLSKLCNRDFRLLRNFDPSRAKLSTWLVVIATSVTIDHLRRLRRIEVPLESAPNEEIAVSPPSIERVRFPEGVLSPRQALVLELLYRREMTAAEVAEVLSIEPQTVRSTHHKALVRLRDHFGDEAEQ